MNQTPHKKYNALVRKDELPFESLVQPPITSSAELKRKFPSEWQAFFDARRRCKDPNYKDYPHYGARGIQYKFRSFVEAFNHLGAKPPNKHSLDRIDNNGHYEIGNVRWATSKQQNRNKRSNRMININGKRMCMICWAEFAEVSIHAFRYRVDKQKVQPEKALNELIALKNEK